MQKDLVKYKGLASEYPTDNEIFTQFILDNFLVVDQCEVNRIINLNSQINIEDLKLIKTAKGLSLENQNLTGSQLMIKGQIRYELSYYDIDECIYNKSFNEYFCKEITLPLTIKSAASINVIPYIENTNTNIITSNKIQICSSIFLEVNQDTYCKSKFIKCKNSNRFITISGIAMNLPCDMKFFKQSLVKHEISIPDNKPKIKDIMSISAENEVIYSELIKTEKEQSIEGQNLSGYKIIVLIKEKYILTYTTENEACMSHVAHYNQFYYSEFIVVPESIDGIDIEILFKRCKLNITPYIQDICIYKVNDRNVYTYNNILINMEPRCL